MKRLAAGAQKHKNLPLYPQSTQRARRHPRGLWRLFALAVALAAAFPLSAEQEKLLVKKNEYGGQTVQFTYEEGDKYASQLASSIYYFNAEGSACRVIHTFNERQAALSGFATQEERFEGGSVLSYKMTLTTKQRAEQGIDYLVEYIGVDNEVVRRQFVKGEYSRTEQVGAFTDSYPLYSLEVLEKYLREDDTQEIVADKELYKFSAQFNRGRSFATFNGGLKSLSNKEKSLINAYMDCYNQSHLAKLFVKKVEVKVGKHVYTAFVQEHLLPFIRKREVCFISYTAVLHNNEMCLLLTGVGALD